MKFLDNEYAVRMLQALESLVQNLGAECDPHLPLPSPEENSSGSRDFIEGTQFDGVNAFVSPPQFNPAAIAAAEVAVDGFGIIIEEAAFPVRVYFRKPTADGAYRTMQAGEWIKRRRGFERFWVFSDEPATEFLPRITVVSEPGFDMQECCDDGGGEMAFVVTVSAQSDAPQTIAVAVPAAWTGTELVIPVDGAYHFEFNSSCGADQGTGDVSFTGTVRVNGVSAGAYTAVRSASFWDPVGGAATPIFIGMHFSCDIPGLVAGDVVNVYCNPISVSAPYAEDGIALGARTAFGIMTGP